MCLLGLVRGFLIGIGNRVITKKGGFPLSFLSWGVFISIYKVFYFSLIYLWDVGFI